MTPDEPLLSPARRHLLGGLAAAALAPSAALADPTGSGPAEAAIRRMIASGLENEKALRRAFPHGKLDGSSPYVVSQRHGAWLASAPAKLGLAARLDEETVRLRADAARGLAPPAFIVRAVLEGQRDTFGLPADAAAALERQSAALEALRPAPGAGVWRLPGGPAYYALRLRCTTGSDLAPAALDARVTAATKALLARADRLLTGLGLARGSVGARLRALKAKGGYADDDAGRTRAVSAMNAALDRLRPRLAEWFNPPFEAQAAVRRMSPADELAHRRGYREPPFYYPDLSAVTDRPAWTLTTVAYHETVPGHVLQLRRQALADPHPLQLRYAAGYSEGWAIHAEGLADRMGLLSPVEQLGYIQSVLFRLARVTTDIGLHLHRWERARAIRYLQETVGFELFFPFDVEVDRYCVEPAGFAGDALVALELGRMGGKLQPAAARGFHDAVLNHGPLSAEALAAVANPSLRGA
jgi:uncharacterized protein (DUF885 family)